MLVPFQSKIAMDISHPFDVFSPWKLGWTEKTWCQPWMKTTPKNAHISKMVPLDFQGKPFYRFGPRIQMIDHPQTMKVAGSLVQFVGTPEVFMKTLGVFFSTLKHARQTAKPSRIAAWGWTVVCFFLLNCLGTLKNIPSSQLSQFVACGFFSKKWTFPPKETWNFSPSSPEDLVHCCFHTLLKRWSFCFVNRTTFFSRVFRGLSQRRSFSPKKNPWVMGCVRKLVHKILHK